MMATYHRNLVEGSAISSELYKSFAPSRATAQNKKIASTLSFVTLRSLFLAPASVLAFLLYTKEMFKQFMYKPQLSYKKPLISHLILEI